MTDKKLTASVCNSNRLTDDEDIMKALECLFGCVDCRKCPYSPRYKFPLCQRQVAKDTRDIIIRQQAETLRLKSMNQAKLDTIHDLQTEIEGLKEKQEKCFYCTEQANKKISEIKSEAYKEFAEKLEEKLCDCRTVSDREYCGFDCGDTHESINNLLKEMVGERRMTDNQEAEKALKKLK